MTTAPRAATGFGPRFVAPLCVGALLNPINSTMIATALVPIGQSYHVGAAATVWLIAALYLASAIAQPVMGDVADRVGPRRVYLGGLVVVALAGLGGVLAPALWVLVGVRVAIGIGTSAAYPAALALVRAQAERVGQPVPGGVLGALTLASLTSATIGPALGGLLVGLAGWPSIFLVNVPLALIGLGLTLWWLPADASLAGHDETLVQALDLPGIALFGVTLTVLLLFLMGLTSPNGALLGGCVVLAALLVAWERRAARPFLDVRMLADNRPLVHTFARYGLTFVVIYGVLYAFPQWLEQARGLSPASAGLLVLPMSVVAGICTMLGARGRRVRGPLLLGTTALLLASVALLWVHAGVGVAALIAVGALFGIPNGLTVVGNQAALYAQAPAAQIGMAAGLFRSAQYIGAIVSASLIGLCYGRRAGDAGLHSLAVIFVALSALLLVGVVVDQTGAPRRLDRAARRLRSAIHAPARDTV